MESGSGPMNDTPRLGERMPKRMVGDRRNEGSPKEGRLNDTEEAKMLAELAWPLVSENATRSMPRDY